MSNLITPALPVPPIGQAHGPMGDAYIRCLQVAIEVDNHVILTVSGTLFETLMFALQFHYLGFHARTRALTAGNMRAVNFVECIERRWASVDAEAQDLPELLTVAEALEAAARKGQTLSWRQVNQQGDI